MTPLAPEITRSSSNVRNERAELLVHYALNSICPDRWKVDRRFLVGQSGFCTEFDHVVKDTGRTLALIGQTTCYKERGISGAEPNKTYEMRETLMEFLLVHVNLMFGESKLKADEIRFFHVMFGDPTYSYSYFHKIRSKCYDLNIVLHPPQGVQELYRALEEALPTGVLNDQKRALDALESAVASKKTPMINEAILTIKNEFSEYSRMNFPQSHLGRIQADAIRDLASERNAKAVRISENLSPGIGIKKRYLEAAKGAIDSNGNDIKIVVERIFKKRSFLPEAKRALENGISNWNTYVHSILIQDSSDREKSLEATLQDLWNISPEGKRGLIRRVLVKLPGAMSGEGTAYPQDIPVKGVTEHNLYMKIFDRATTLKLVSYMLCKFKEANVTKVEDLRKGIYSFGRSIIKNSFDYDIENGTVIRPVFYYVVQALEQSGYRVKKQKDVFGSTIKGYHEKLFDVDIGAFTSIEVICRETGEPLALFKAKYFRRPEFDRRVKEEAFVSFTSAFEVRKEGDTLLLKRRQELPYVMFVDIDPEWTPAPESVKQLVRMGWNVFFRIPDLLDFLSSLKTGSSKTSA